MEGPSVLTEEAAIAFDAPEPFGTAVRATVEGERLALHAPGIEGVVLRYGRLYGPRTYYSREGYFAGEARRHRLPVVGKGSGVMSFVHVQDAASAAVCALPRGSGVYNIVDADPAPARALVAAFAQAVGAPRSRAEDPLLGGQPAGREVGGVRAHGSSWRLERAGKVRVGLAASLPQLAPGLRRSHLTGMCLAVGAPLDTARALREAASPGSDDRPQHQQADYECDLAAQYHAVEVECRYPADIAAGDHVHTHTACVGTPAATAAALLTCGLVLADLALARARSGAPPDASDRNDKDAVPLDRLAEDAADGQCVLSLLQDLVGFHRFSMRQRQCATTTASMITAQVNVLDRRDHV